MRVTSGINKETLSRHEMKVQRPSSADNAMNDRQFCYPKNRHDFRFA
jgi:hypothetical protein